MNDETRENSPLDAPTITAPGTMFYRPVRMSKRLIEGLDGFAGSASNTTGLRIRRSTLIRAACELAIAAAPFIEYEGIAREQDFEIALARAIAKSIRKR